MQQQITVNDREKQREKERIEKERLRRLMVHNDHYYILACLCQNEASISLVSSRLSCFLFSFLVFSHVELPPSSSLVLPLSSSLSSLSTPHMHNTQAEDERGYRELIDKEKDKRLVYLLDKTDEYLVSMSSMLTQHQRNALRRDKTDQAASSSSSSSHVAMHVSRIMLLGVASMYCVIALTFLAIFSF